MLITSSSRPLKLVSSSDRNFVLRAMRASVPPLDAWHDTLDAIHDCQLWRPLPSIYTPLENHCLLVACDLMRCLRRTTGESRAEWERECAEVTQKYSPRRAGDKALLSFSMFHVHLGPWQMLAIISHAFWIAPRRAHANRLNNECALVVYVTLHMHTSDSFIFHICIRGNVYFSRNAYESWIRHSNCVEASVCFICRCRADACAEPN